MKSLIISIVLILSILTFNTLSYNKLEDTVSDLKNMCNEINISLKSNDIIKAKEKTNDLNDMLKAVEVFLISTVPHDEIDQINLYKEALSAYIDYGEIPEAVDKINSLNFMFDHLLECEKLSLGNIF